MRGHSVQKALADSSARMVAKDATHKRPPEHTRFRPGRSGNPSGRPKRRPSFRAALLAELAMMMPGQDKERSGSKLLST
jgi:hypothetical protein